MYQDNARDSKPWWPPTVVPPKQAPNVLLIMTDDAGYGSTNKSMKHTIFKTLSLAAVMATLPVFAAGPAATPDTDTPGVEAVP